MTKLLEASTTAFLDGEDSLEIDNIIHSTDGAKAFGYEAPLGGGVTVWGWGSRTIIDLLGARWLHDGWADVFFKRPVFPGFELTTRVEERPDGNYEFSMTNSDGKVCLLGTCAMGRAAWADDHTVPPAAEPMPTADPLPALTPETLQVGDRLRPQAVLISTSEASEYGQNLQRDQGALWRGAEALIHPGWLAGRGTRLMHHSWAYGPAIHARSQIQNVGPARAGQTVQVTGQFVDTYERKGHHVRRHRSRSTKRTRRTLLPPPPHNDLSSREALEGRLPRILRRAEVRG